MSLCCCNSIIAHEHIYLSHPLLCNFSTYTNRIYNNLSPKWTTIFIVEHSTTKSWTPLRITIHDSRSKKSSDVGRHRSITNGSHDITVYKSSDPVMGEVNVEVGEILRSEGQEVRLDLESGGW